MHSKVCVVDDVWMAVGSDNLNRRSWTHDSEISCAVIDPAMRLARDTRLRLAREHTGGDDDSELIDPTGWFDTLRSAAGALDAWHRDGQQGARPPGHLRAHPTERVTRLQRWAFHGIHARVLDPDGRPWRLRRDDDAF